MLNRNILCQITSFHFYKNTLYIPYHIISYYTLCYIIKLYIYTHRCTIYCTRLNYFTIYWIYYVTLCYIILYDKIPTLHDIFTLHHITVLDHIILYYTISYTKKRSISSCTTKDDWGSDHQEVSSLLWSAGCVPRGSPGLWFVGRLQGGGELVDTSMVNLKDFISLFSIKKTVKIRGVQISAMCTLLTIFFPREVSPGCQVTLTPSSMRSHRPPA